ncbi:glycoside hydrolase family 3 N-terminal domain-containing protein [Salinibacterium sp.]|uniref:glycoside hydrolase family 3 N-terminal domain-containing protein n=1 Tax=Salinibacterium sp. TaxID=1915057 RepID=UPI0037CBDA44
MFGHLQFDAVDPVPATLSARWHRILRDELDFEGIIITDDMNMLEDSGRAEYATRRATPCRRLSPATRCCSLRSRSTSRR